MNKKRGTINRNAGYTKHPFRASAYSETAYGWSRILSKLCKSVEDAYAYLRGIAEMGEIVEMI